MKNLPYTKKEFSLFYNKPATTPFIHQFIAFVSALKSEKSQLPAPFKLPETDNRSLLIKPILSVKQQLSAEWNARLATKEVAGLARSLVFFNWKNYA